MHHFFFFKFIIFFLSETVIYYESFISGSAAHAGSDSKAEDEKKRLNPEEELGESLDLTPRIIKVREKTRGGVGGHKRKLRVIYFDNAEEPVSAPDLRPKQGKYPPKIKKKKKNRYIYNEIYCGLRSSSRTVNCSE